jgi:hypothetical protein
MGRSLMVTHGPSTHGTCPGKIASQHSDRRVFQAGRASSNSRHPLHTIKPRQRRFDRCQRLSWLSTFFGVYGYPGIGPRGNLAVTFTWRARRSVRTGLRGRLGPPLRRNSSIGQLSPISSLGWAWLPLHDLRHTGDRFGGCPVVQPLEN